MNDIELYNPPTSAVFCPADGWGIIAQLLIRMAAAFGAHGALARRTLHAETVRALLGWLRPAEELARKLLYVMARAMSVETPESTLQTSGATPSPAPSPREEGAEPDTWRVSFVLFKSATRARLPHPSRHRHRRSLFDDDDYHFRDRETERAARDARVGGGVQPLWLRDWRDRPRAEPPPSAPERNLAAPLARRIEALVRLIADPERWALKLARRLHAASHEARAALVAPFHKPHERTRRTPCPAGLSLTDRLIAEAACDTS